jgi:phage/plasmid-associated DNA primase
VVDGTGEELSILSSKRKRDEILEQNQWREIEDAFNREYDDDMVAGEQLTWDLEDVDFSPLYLPEAVDTSNDRTITSMLRQDEYKLPQWRQTIYNWVTNVFDGIEICLLNGLWPFFKQKGRQAARGPSFIAMDLYNSLVNATDIPSDLIIVNWLMCARKDRTERFYGIISASELFTLIINDIEQGGTSINAKTIFSYMGKKLKYGVKSYLSIPMHSRTFAQLIPSNTRVRLYFDVDWYCEEQITPEMEKDHIRKLLQTIHKVLYSLDFLPVIEHGWQILDHFVVLKAHRKIDDKKYKLSMHIHFLDLFVENNHDTMKKLYTHMLKEADDNELFDKAVASKNRIMRMAHCHVAYDKKKGTQSQQSSELLPYKCIYIPSNESPQDVVFTRIAISDLCEHIGAFCIHDPQADEKQREICSDLFVDNNDSNNTGRISTTTNINQNFDRLYNDLEWKCIYQIFGQFLDDRKRRHGIAIHTQLDGIGTMKELESQKTIVYINCSQDRFCEYKDREHANDANGTQTGYGYCGIRQVCWQTCFSCNRQLTGTDTKFYSFAPGYTVLRPLQPSMFTSLVQQETTCGMLFIAEYNHFIKVVPNGARRQLYIYDHTTALWQCDNTSFITKTWPLWINRKYLLLTLNMNLSEDDEKRLHTWLAGATKFDKINGIIKFITNRQNDPDFEEKLNKKSHLIPLQNIQTYDVLTGDVRTRVLEDYFSESMKFKFTRKDDPQIEEVVSIMNDFANGDATWLEYMHMLLGYFHTGFTVDRGYYLWLGVGLNGKGTVANALKKSMGEFYQTADASFITKTGNSNFNCESASPTLASLQHARVCMISELPVHCKLAEDKLKGLTSGDITKARNLYSSPKSWIPQFKIPIQSNYCPELNCSDQAAVDRFRAMWWGARFVKVPTRPNEKKMDAAKAEALRSTLIDAFGTWCCVGAYNACSATNNFRTTIPRPPIVQDYMQKTLRQADLIASFLDTEGDIDNPDAHWSATDMYQSFKSWAQQYQATLAQIALPKFIEEVVKRTEQRGLVTLTEINGVQKFKGITKKIRFELDELQF